MASDIPAELVRDLNKALRCLGLSVRHQDPVGTIWGLRETILQHPGIQDLVRGLQSVYSELPGLLQPEPGTVAPHAKATTTGDAQAQAAPQRSVDPAWRLPWPGRRAFRVLFLAQVGLVVLTWVMAAVLAWQVANGTYATWLQVLKLPSDHIPGWVARCTTYAAHYLALGPLALVMWLQLADIRDRAVRQLRGHGIPTSELLLRGSRAGSWWDLDRWFGGIARQSGAFVSQGVMRASLAAVAAMHTTITAFWLAYVLRGLGHLVVLILLSIPPGGHGVPSSAANQATMSAQTTGTPAPASATPLRELPWACGPERGLQVEPSGEVRCTAITPADPTVGEGRPHIGAVRLLDLLGSAGLVLAGAALFVLYDVLRHRQPGSSPSGAGRGYWIGLTSLSTAVLAARILGDVKQTIISPEDQVNVASYLAYVVSHLPMDVFLFSALCLVASRLDTALIRGNVVVALAIFGYAALEPMSSWALPFQAARVPLYVLALLAKLLLFSAFQHVIVTGRLSFYLHSTQQVWQGLGSSFQAFLKGVQGANQT